MRPSIAIPLILVAAAGTVYADGADEVAATSPGFPGDGVEIVEQLGATVPVDVPLRDYTGKDVTLGELLAGDIPTILTFNYSNCPNLCSYQLNGLVTALPKLRLKVGGQFRIVTIVLDPKEPLERTRETRDRYVSRLPKGSEATGWTFATTRTPGDSAPIQRIADAVGFHYKWIPETASWAHPAALIFVSSRGRVIRYVHGVDYAKDDLETSLAKAGTDEPTAAVGFIMRCLHWEGSASAGAKLAPALLRYAAAGFLVLFATAFGVWHLVRRHRMRTVGAGERQ